MPEITSTSLAQTSIETLYSHCSPGLNSKGREAIRLVNSSKSTLSFETKDFVEGTKAFMEKRKPKFN